MENNKNEKDSEEFIFKGCCFVVHYSADNIGVYGIRKDIEDNITFLKELSKRYNLEYKQAYKHFLNSK